MHCKWPNLEFIDQDFLKNYPTEHTRMSYLNDLKQFIEFLSTSFSQITSWPEIQRTHIIEFRNYLQELEGRNYAQLAPKTISRKLAALSSYFDYIIEKYSAPENNPTLSVKRPKRISRTPTEHLDKDKIKDLFSALESAGEKVKALHKALIYVLFYTGIRKSEIIQLKRSDYLTHEDTPVLRVRVKGGKFLVKALHPMAQKALEEYIAYMEQCGRFLEKEDWLFQPTINRADASNLEKNLNPRTLNRIIQKYGLIAGLNERISPHSARASFITHLLEEGVEISAVAKEVGHASVLTTQEYDRRRRPIKEGPVSKIRF